MSTERQVKDIYKKLIGVINMKPNEKEITISLEKADKKQRRKKGDVILLPKVRGIKQRPNMSHAKCDKDQKFRIWTINK